LKTRLCFATYGTLALALLVACTPGKDGNSRANGTLDSATAARLLPDLMLKFTVACGEGRNRAFLDDTADALGGWTHQLHGELDYPLGAFVETNGLEGEKWIFLSRKDCSEIPLLGEVVFNPSRTRFASIGHDNVWDHGTNGVQILASRADSGIVVWEYLDLLIEDSADLMGPTRWAWDDDSTLVVTLRDLEDHRVRREYRYAQEAWTRHDESLPDSVGRWEAAPSASRKTGRENLSWVLDSIPKDLSKVDSSDYSKGSIGGEEYLAINFTIHEDSGQDNRYFVLAKILAGGRYESLFVWDATLDYLCGKIDPHSILIEAPFAHHGTYSDYYRFKPEGGKFVLTGISRQRLVPEEVLGGQDVEMWSGEAYDLLALKAVYWAQVYPGGPMVDGTIPKRTYRRHNLGLPCADCPVRKMDFKPIRFQDLESFNPWNAKDGLPEHYFDRNLEFHIHTP
jgi:hypothetical protein